MTTPHQEAFLPIPKWDIPDRYVIYQDQLVLKSVYNWICLGHLDTRATFSQSDLSQCMLNLQLESFAGGVKGANIVSWLQSNKTCLCIYQVPEPMWVATASGHLMVPAAVWFTNWASQEFEVTWVVMVDSIMLGIVCPSKKAQKAGKPVSRLTKLTDLNQTVD
ncbi:hypothetical protein DSO57_1015988 [Entomophthora muscae]|uniref:Uncharacterized protein n=1 Tax=Entomophthora muscae TaxID=34485 RepID=A0ACC2U332_9FUNG|nr:hypothetical protein DSO57_1015988 [Entomophthora muscae]